MAPKAQFKDRGSSVPTIVSGRATPNRGNAVPAIYVSDTDDRTPVVPEVEATEPTVVGLPKSIG
jgi:hypothetical protein